MSNDGCVRNDNGEVVFFCVPTDIGYVKAIFFSYLRVTFSLSLFFYLMLIKIIIRDGELAAMMLTALERCKSDHAVRLVRSWKVPSSYAPKEEGSYRYDGLYKITTVWMEKCKDSASDLCAFRLEREKGQPPLPHPAPPIVRLSLSLSLSLSLCLCLSVSVSVSLSLSLSLTVIYIYIFSSYLAWREQRRSRELAVCQDSRIRGRNDSEGPRVPHEPGRHFVDNPTFPQPHTVALSHNIRRLPTNGSLATVTCS